MTPRGRVGSNPTPGATALPTVFSCILLVFPEGLQALIPELGDMLVSMHAFTAVDAKAFILFSVVVSHELT